MAEWRDCKLGEVINLKRGYDLPHDDRIPGPFPIVSSSGITDHHAVAKVKGPGVITGRYGTLGEVFFVEEDFWPLNTSLYVQDFKGNEPRFISYFLRQLNFGTRNAAGAVPGVNRNHLHAIDVRVPPLPVQRRIADILSAYDELIENSQKRIRILETMARALYREWFVQFRFPGHEKVPRVDSPLCEIPKGWELKLVKDVLSRFAAGTVYREADVKLDGTTPVVDQSTNELLGFHDNEPDHFASPATPIAIFGDHTCKMQLLIEPFSVGPNVVPFTAAGGLPTAYVFYAVNSLVQTQEYKRHWIPLNAKEIVVANAAMAQRFASLIQPMLVGQETLRKTIRNLRRTRDLLLPRLLSGQVSLVGT